MNYKTKMDYIEWFTEDLMGYESIENAESITEIKKVIEDESPQHEVIDSNIIYYHDIDNSIIELMGTSSISIILNNIGDAFQEFEGTREVTLDMNLSGKFLYILLDNFFNDNRDEIIKNIWEKIQENKDNE